MYKYQIVDNDKIIIKELPGLRMSFSENPDNTDYQEYLKWVAEGNVAEEQ